jgi:hypothetical protein
MSRAEEADDASEFKTLQCLLKIFHDIYALDAEGNDVFAYVNELRDWPERFQRTDLDHGSYKQDLWYCALARNKLDVRYSVQPRKRLARYTQNYTPKNYYALCHLDDWDRSRDDAYFERQMQELLLEHPLSEEEERIQQEIGSAW